MVDFSFAAYLFIRNWPAAHNKYEEEKMADQVMAFPGNRVKAMKERASWKRAIQFIIENIFTWNNLCSKKVQVLDEFKAQYYGHSIAFFCRHT